MEVRIQVHNEEQLREILELVKKLKLCHYIVKEGEA